MKRHKFISEEDRTNKSLKREGDLNQTSSRGFFVVSEESADKVMMPSIPNRAVESDDESDEETWETVDTVNNDNSAQSNAPDICEQEDGAIEIFLGDEQPNGASEPKPAVRTRRKITKKDRLERLELHKSHLLLLFASVIVRNRWCNDKELKDVCFNLLSKTLRTELLTVNKKSLQSLCTFWHSFFSSSPTPPIDYSNTTILLEIAKFISSCDSENRFIHHDVSVFALVATCRSLGMKTRLVSALHPIPLSFSSKDNNVTQLNHWVEVYSHEDREWIMMYPAQNIFNNVIALEAAFRKQKIEFSYVIVLETEFGAKDLTKKYSSEYHSKAIRLRMPSTEIGEEWWNKLIWSYSKSEIEDHDLIEDFNLQNSMHNEVMPTNLTGFINHPLYSRYYPSLTSRYALERHCKKNETIYPIGVEHSIGRYNKLYVYPRANVKQILSPENWLKKGLIVKQGEEPFQVVSTGVRSQRKRERELRGTNEPSTTRLYGEWQTEKYTPPDIIDGIIPRNSFGNIELFHEHMLPGGAVHIKLNGLGKLAKALNISYAEAVTGFQYGARTIPIIEGIVVAKEYKDVIIMAHHEDMIRKREKEALKLEKLITGRWRLLAMKLLQKQVLFERYMPED